MKEIQAGGKNKQGRGAFTEAVVTAYQNTFRGKDGDIVLYDLMKAGHFIKPTTVENDPVTSAVNEGKRELLLHILNALYTDKERLIRARKQIQTGMDFEKEYNFENNK